MSKGKQVLIRIDADLYAALETIKENEGVPVAEQVRRAIKRYLREKAMKDQMDEPEMGIAEMLAKLGIK